MQSLPPQFLGVMFLGRRRKSSIQGGRLDNNNFLSNLMMFKTIWTQTRNVKF